ncbi:MAG: sugar phosphate isomerase/epimerase family protein [Planctomycetota bacterium]
MSVTVSPRIGVCSWSLQPKNLDELVGQLAGLKLERLQLGLDPLRTDPDSWEDAALRLRDAGVSVVSGQFGAVGEDYTTPQTIRATGGVVPDETWPANRENADATAELARQLGLTLLSTHAGFIPPDESEPVFAKLVGRVRTLAELFAQRCGAKLLLETGQETADTLNRFLLAVDRPNVGVNFDPANMLLYDMGDPVESVRRLMSHVRQVHIKDATPPSTPGSWGEEVVVGDGAVDWAAFLGELDASGYDGSLVIESEAGTQRAEDIATAARRLNVWLDK